MCIRDSRCSVLTPPIIARSIWTPQRFLWVPLRWPDTNPTTLEDVSPSTRARMVCNPLQSSQKYSEKFHPTHPTHRFFHHERYIISSLRGFPGHPRMTAQHYVHYVERVWLVPTHESPNLSHRRDISRLHPQYPLQYITRRLTHTLSRYEPAFGTPVGH